MLLLKERLRRAAPELIYARLEPILEQDRVVWRGKGSQTVDAGEIASRWKSLKFRDYDQQKLKHLPDIRNDLEHRAPKVEPEVLREAVADTFVLVYDLLTHHLAAAPTQVLSDACWETLRRAGEVHQKIDARCRESRTLAAQALPPPVADVVRDRLSCPACESTLLLVEDGTDPDVEATTCQACGQRYSLQDLLEPYCEAADSDAFGECPTCGRHTFSEPHDICFACLESRPYKKCQRCCEDIPLDEQHLSGLCGYCAHVLSRDD